MKVLFVAGFGPIVNDVDASRTFYKKILGIALEEDQDHYMYTGDLEGVRHFALWPLSHAALSCFGSNEWPIDIPVPTSWLEFDVEDVTLATKELEEAGHKLLVSVRREPWGQTVSRLLSPEGILLGVTCTPALRDNQQIG